MLPGVASSETVFGVRRLPPRNWWHRRRYELRWTSGDAASCSLSRLHRLVGGSAKALLEAADDAVNRGDERLLRWPTGVPLGDPPQSDAPAERLHRHGVWIVSSRGYRVRATGRAGMEYTDEHGSLYVATEWIATNTLVFAVDKPPDGRFTVLDRIARAWLWAGFDVEAWPGSAPTAGAHP